MILIRLAGLAGGMVRFRLAESFSPLFCGLIFLCFCHACGESKTSRLPVVPQQKILPGEGRYIPSGSLENGIASDFIEGGWIRFDEDDITVFGLDDGGVADQNVLTVAIAAIFPESLSVLEIDACKESFIESIGILATNCR